MWIINFENWFGGITLRLMAENINRLAPTATKLHPVFIALLDKSVSKNKYQSVNHAINAALFVMFEPEMSKNQIQRVKKVKFGGGSSNTKLKKTAPTTL